MVKSPDGRPIAAFVLAGRRSGGSRVDPLTGFEGAPHKAFISFVNKPMIAHVIDALAGAGFDQRTSVIGDDDVLSLIKNSEYGASLDFLVAADSLSATMEKVLEAVGEKSSVLVTTADHALLTPSMINEFLDRIDPLTEVAAAVVSEKIYRQEFPEGPRTFLRFSDQTVSGANLFWLASSQTQPLIEFWRRLETNRKNPFAMAREIGLSTGIAYLAGLLSSESVIARISKKTGVRAQLVRLPIAEAAIDVDKPEDVPLVRDVFRRRSS